MNNQIDMPERKILESIKMVNPTKKSLDELTMIRIDYMRKGYYTKIDSEQLSKNINVRKLIIYEKN